MSVYAYAMGAAAALLREVRAAAGLSLRGLAEAAGVATSTVHRIERGLLQPTVETLERIAEAAGVRVDLEPRIDSSASLVGLARAIREDLRGAGGAPSAVRRAAELVARFDRAGPAARRRMIAAAPPPTGDERWDAFAGALGEWLAMRGRLRAPAWVGTDRRFLRRGWWVTPAASLRAWEYAGSPAAFKIRGVYLHRDSLVNV